MRTVAVRTSNIDVRVRMLGARTFQSDVRRSAAELEAMGVVGARSLGKFAAQADKLKNFGSRMSRSVTLPIVALGALSGKVAIDFEKSMAQVGVALGVPQDELDGLRDLAVKMGADTIFSANEAAQAMLELSKGGMKQAEIQGGALEATMSLAAAGGIDLAEAAVQTSSAMNTFGLEAAKATSIADSLAGGANASSADLSDLALSLQQAGQQATASGFSLYETVGALAAFADAGIRGSDAGTSLKTFLQRLNPTSAKAKELMDKLGLSFFDAEGNMLGLTGIADELREGLRGMTQEQRLAAMQTLFGSDATRAANIIYNEGSKGLRRYIDATKEKGAADKMAAAQMQGLPGAWERLKGSMETAALTAGQAAAPAMEFLAVQLGAVANAFATLPPGMQTAVVTFLMLAAVVGPLSSGLGYMAAGVGRLLIVLRLLIPVLRGSATSMLAWRLGLAAAAVRANGLRWAVMALSIAMRAIPIIAIVSGLALLAGALVQAYNKVEWFRNAVNAVWNWIKSNWKLLAVILAGPIALAAIKIIENWGKIKGAFVAAFGVIKTVINAVRTAIEFVIDKLDWALDKVNELASKAGDVGEALVPGGEHGIASEQGLLGIGGIPGLQGGGTITAPGLTVVGEHGPELLRLPKAASVIPLDLPAAGAGAGGDTVIKNVIELDGRVVAESTTRHAEKRKARK